jgi:HTH-type transcriptional regulator/antitoxin HigA
MYSRLIKTEQDYQNALSRIDHLWESKKNTHEGDELELLITLVEKYEQEKFSIEFASPVEVIKFKMEQMGLSNKDMIKFLGSQSRVSEILNGKRKLSIAMIKSLNRGLKIPAEALLG